MNKCKETSSVTAEVWLLGTNPGLASRLFYLGDHGENCDGDHCLT